MLADRQAKNGRGRVKGKSEVDTVVRQLLLLHQHQGLPFVGIQAYCSTDQGAQCNSLSCSQLSTRFHRPSPFNFPSREQEPRAVLKWSIWYNLRVLIQRGLQRCQLLQFARQAGPLHM